MPIVKKILHIYCSHSDNKIAEYNRNQYKAGNYCGNSRNFLPQGFKARLYYIKSKQPYYSEVYTCVKAYPAVEIVFIVPVIPQKQPEIFFKYVRCRIFNTDASKNTLKNIRNGVIISLPRYIFFSASLWSVSMKNSAETRKLEYNSHAEILC